MFRRLAAMSALGMTLGVFATSAHAQGIYYPGGYGGYGWGGWGGGQTVQGSIAQGMGVFAAGAGYYNEATAEANAINANTAMNWNEYWYQSQQAVNRKYYAKMAARKKQNVEAHTAIYKRLRDNPSRYDIYRGDALNVIYDQLCSPKIYVNGLKTASTKFPGAQIRDIPFSYAQAAITTSVHKIMDKGSAPAVLRGDAFKPENDQLREIGQTIREEDEKDGLIDPETLDKAEALIKKLQVKVADNLKKGSTERNDAERFLKSALGLSHMLRTPAINVLLSDVDKHPEATVGDLLGFMRAFNLRFGAADTPRERYVYDELYPLLAKLRDEAFPNAKPDLPEETATNPEHAKDFFAKMEDKAIAPTQPPPPPSPGTAKAKRGN
jgi:hypothetical protein